MRPFTCYLSGPITGLNYKGATGWREWVRGNLSPHVAGLNPMRGKDYLDGAEALDLQYENHVMSTAAGIYGRDLWDTMRCDVMLVNVSDDKPERHIVGPERIITDVWPKSIGTIVEIGWFTTRQNPLVLCGNPDHPIIKHPLTANRATYITQSLKEAVNCVNALFADER